MRKLFLIIPIAAILAASACGRTAKSPEATSMNQQGESAVTPAKDSNFVVINDTMNGLSDKKTYEVDARDGQTLFAGIAAPVDTANIRINRIISPSGNADGPFGKEVTFPVTETGTWKIIVGGSLMQGEDYKGGYKLTLVVK
jgi:hypothetical protein